MQHAQLQLLPSSDNMAVISDGLLPLNPISWVKGIGGWVIGGLILICICILYLFLVF